MLSLEDCHAAVWVRYSGPKEINYLFVDGGAPRGNLINLPKRFFGDYPFELNFASLASDFTKVFYCDALPVREATETEQAYFQRIALQKAVLDRAAATDRVRVTKETLESVDGKDWFRRRSRSC